MSDVKFRLEPGEIKNVQKPGKFIFVKFCERPISLIMDQERSELDAGDRYVSDGPFGSFQIENLDQDNPAYIVLEVGYGDFGRMIVRGEISIEPILRNADGTTKPDTRHQLSIDLMPSNLALTTYNAGDIKLQVIEPNGANHAQTVLFRGPDGTIGYNWYDGYPMQNFRVSYLDPKTLDLLSTDHYYSDHNTIFADVTYWPGRGLIILEPQYDRIMVPDGAGGFNVLINLPTSGNNNADSICIDSATNNLYVFAPNNVDGPDNLIYVFDFNLNLINQFQASRYHESLEYDPVSDRLVQQNGTGEVVFLDKNTGAQLEIDSHPGADYTGNRLVVIGGSTYGFNVSTDAVQIRATRGYTTKPEFIATRAGCELLQAIKKPGALPQVTAEVTATEYPTGVALSGEIIRAAIEYYFGRAAPDDYLDHVYQFDVSRGGNGLPFKTINTGNETFKKANIADQFTTLLPGRIVLVVDNEISLGASL